MKTSGVIGGPFICTGEYVYRPAWTSVPGGMDGTGPVYYYFRPLLRPELC